MTTLFGESEQYKIVNVATVPMRSPFRYPGEKTWLVPTIRQWLNSLQQPVSLLVEPFAGGGIVGLTAAFEKLVNKVMLVELDADIASVWLTILNGKGEWLADEIAGFDLTPEAVHAISSGTPTEYHLRALEAQPESLYCEYMQKELRTRMPGDPLLARIARCLTP